MHFMAETRPDWLGGREFSYHLDSLLTGGAVQLQSGMNSVLVIDDERNIRTLVSRVLGQDNIEVHMAGTGKEGLELADQVDPDLALVDLRLPDVDGIQVLRDLRTKHPQTAVIMITAFGHIESVVAAMKNGATDYLEKPFQHLEKLRISVSRALEEVKARREINRLQGLEEGKYRTSQIIGEAAPTRRLREVITQLAQSEAHTILVQGESGTGKELVARGLHFESNRRNSPFMEVNCAAITETLFESELFGHEKGAFTDAKSTKKGLMELADGGTLFLDEVGEIPVASQAKLLRCLQERTFKRVGGTRDIKVDVRVTAATNRSLEGMVKEGKFREDLFYRLNVIPLTIPPLRDRREDILPLGRHFLSEANNTFHKAVKRLAPETETLLLSYGWPGNVRELKNLIERLVILSTGDTIEADQLPMPVTGDVETPAPEEVSREPRTLASVEKSYILKVLRQVNGNKSEAAKILGITRQTLRKKLTEDPS
jgi:two-component system, NtrC family, response regulator AtoC